ncbi:MAG: hypothetical protein GY696_35745 [Gammaproteobacteria bacterium]|nr:hypothetical protein [Gammaproteobacteria bacterium]
MKPAQPWLDLGGLPNLNFSLPRNEPQMSQLRPLRAVDTPLSVEDP